MAKLAGIVFLISCYSIVFAQEGEIHGIVKNENGPLEMVLVGIKGTSFGAYSEEDGHYHLSNLDSGQYTLEVAMMGYKYITRKVILNKGESKTVNFSLVTDAIGLDAMVITSTRERVPKQNSPVIVNVIDNKTFENTQSLSLSEGLSFQPGLRVETNCQNCGFTQVRINGLDGPYSQVLIDGRAVFSALNGVYGLDQIPANMIDRVEVVRGGGSALYGGNAIAGTINIITKDPIYNTFQVSENMALIDGNTADNVINANASVVTDDLNAGLTLFGFNRSRNPYDANGDGFSEITKLRNNTFGMKGFYKPSKLHRLGIEFHAINEFRRGGNMFDEPAHLTDITEQLDHKTKGGAINYEFYNKSELNKYTIYLSTQTTDRKSYYGGGGNIDLSSAENNEDSLALLLQQQEASRFYGKTEDLNLVGGIQMTHKIETLLKGEANFIVGAENQYSDVEDQMPGYNRAIDQKTNDLGMYGQLQLIPFTNTTALLGLRYDLVNIEGNYLFAGDLQQENSQTLGVLNPRISLMHNLSEAWKIRLGYATGFRAPQAFDEDLHLSTVGGEAQIITLDPNLSLERSESVTASATFTKAIGKTQTYFVLDGFYTHLKNPFINETLETSGDENFQRVLKRNGDGASVYGANMEAVVAPSSKIKVQLGATWQRAVYDSEEVVYTPSSENDDSTVTSNRILKTPNLYGYTTINYTPNAHWSFNTSAVYTGSMLAPEVVDPETQFTTLNNTPSFVEWNLKVAYRFELKGDVGVQLFAGVQNLLNSYQKDFQTGAERDANYIYGPSRPRTFFFGLKIDAI